MSNSDDECGKYFANGNVLWTCELLYSTNLDSEDWFGQMETEPKRQPFQLRPCFWLPAFIISPFSHQSSDRGEQALGTGGFHSNSSSMFHCEIPSLRTHWPRLCNPPAHADPIAISPHGKFSCKVLFCLSPFAAVIQKRLCFQFPKMETSACNFENHCQGSHLLFWSALSDMWTVPRAVQREKTPLGKQVLPIRAASLDSCPLWNKSKRQSHECSSLNSYPTPAQEGEWSVQKAQVRTPSKFTSVLGVVSYSFHVSPCEF